MEAMKSKTVIKQFTAWSYSRYRDYSRCPLFAKLKHLDKLPEGEESPQMARGTLIHKIAEDYLRGAIRGFPAELLAMKKYYEAARCRKGMELEEQWLFDKDHELIGHTFPPEVNDPKNPFAWFDTFNNADWAAWRRIYLRVKMDLNVVDRDTNVLIVVDHKTGKFRDYELESYGLQLEIYAMSGMIKYPDVAGVSPRMWYVDAGVQYGEDLFFPRKDQPRLIKLWDQRVKPMFNDTKFKPKPNNKCRYCGYRKEVDGPCEF
jgi:hypothetical protein